MATANIALTVQLASVSTAEWTTQMIVEGLKELFSSFSSDCTVHPHMSSVHSELAATLWITVPTSIAMAALSVNSRDWESFLVRFILRKLFRSMTISSELLLNRDGDDGSSNTNTLRVSPALSAAEGCAQDSVSDGDIATAKKAMEILLRSESLSEGWYRIGEAYLVGSEPFPLSNEKGKEYLEKSTSCEFHPRAEYRLAQIHRSANDMGSCFRRLEGLSKRKLPHDVAGTVLLELGDHFYFGHGVQVGHDQAFALYFRAATEHKNVHAQYACGVCYALGHGVDQSWLHAVYWYRQAAERGLSQAQVHLGECYYFGTGVDKDYEQAIYWHRKGAEQENPGALCCLGVCYEHGHGVPQCLETAVKLYRKAAEEYHLPQAAYDLANLYFEGKGVVQSYRDALQWYSRAASDGVAQAQHNLGICFLKGLGTSQSSPQAVSWFRRAAENANLPSAQFALGLCYYSGEGVDHSVEHAMKWFDCAASHGHPLAGEALSILRENCGDPVTRSSSRLSQDIATWISELDTV